MRWFTGALIAIVIIGSVAFAETRGLQCWPRDKYWLFPLYGYCVDQRILRWCWAAFDILTYLAICILPLPSILKLRSTIRWRLLIASLLVAGLFVSAAGGIAANVLNLKILRLGEHVSFLPYLDVGWDEAPTAIWTDVEAAVGLIAACIPSVWTLLVQLCPEKLARLLDKKDGSTTTISDGSTIHEETESKFPSPIIHVTREVTVHVSGLTPELDSYFGIRGGVRNRL